MIPELCERRLRDSWLNVEQMNPSLAFRGVLSSIQDRVRGLKGNKTD
jgi:hypothetical protein